MSDQPRYEGFPLAAAAAAVGTAAAAYEPGDMWTVATDLRQLPEVFASVALALRTYSLRLEDYALEQPVRQELQSLYAGLSQLAQHAQEVEPLFRAVHADDLKRGEAPRTGEAGWNVGPAAGGAAPQAAGGQPITQASEPMTKPTPAPQEGYEAEAAALRQRLETAACPTCGQGAADHTFLPDDAGHAHAWCDRADGETPTPYATAPPIPPADDASVEARIRAAYASLASRPGAWLRNTDVRRELADVPSEALDAAFRVLSRADDVDMMGESNQKTLTAEDRRNAVRYGGQDAHLIAIGIPRW